MRAPFLMFSILAGLLFTQGAMAQRSLATIVGSVLDPTGAPVSGAQIAVVSSATRETRKLSSLDDGGFAVRSWRRAPTRSP
jgi:hypothetical protein